MRRPLVPGLAALALALCAPVAPAAAVLAAGTPVKRVLGMLGDMKAKGADDMDAEKRVFNDFEKFTVRQDRELTYEIKTGKAQVEKLIAGIDKAEGDIETLGAQIKTIDGDTSATEADRKAAAALREKERSQFLEGQTSYTESLYALDRAIQLLEAQGSDWSQAASLLQKVGKTMPGIRGVLAALELGQTRGRRSSGAQPSGAPAVAAYESQSGGVVEMLELLKKRFAGELADLEKEEMNAAHAYDMETVHSDSILANLVAEREALAESKARAAQASAVAKGELAEAKSNLAEAQKFLADLTTAYRVKKATFETNQQVRAEELEAIAQAIEIISSPEVAGAYADHVKTFLQEEADSEADHKAYCDEELRKNKLKRDKLDSHAARLHGEIEETTVAIEQMAKEIAVLAKEQADLRGAVKEATASRSEEKAANLAAIKDSQQAKTALAQAIAILKEFYGQQGELVQVSAKKQALKLKPYAGMQGESGGVIGMLEVIESDFARVEADAESGEAQAAEAYAKFMSDAEADLKAKHDAEFRLGLRKDQAEFEREQLQKDLDATQKQLGMATTYYEELKPQCVNVRVSYEERAARRKEEIAALQDAYRALDGKVTRSSAL